MHTQCPHCQTIFKVSSAHLNIAQGHVRCGRCHHVFNASHHLIRQLPTQSPEEQFLMDEESNLEFQNEDIPELHQADIYEFRKRSSWGTFMFWGVLVILFAAMLTGQTVWFLQRDMILQHSQIRPLLDKFCYIFLCTLPPTRNLQKFQVQNHVAQTHTDIKDAILFEATFTNNANFPQPYPYLQLTFEDHNGNSLAQRRFKPTEYLQKPLKRNQQMRAQAQVHVKLELIGMADFVEDGVFVAGYRFEFL